MFHVSIHCKDADTVAHFFIQYYSVTEAPDGSDTQWQIWYTFYSLNKPWGLQIVNAKLPELMSIRSEVADCFSNKFMVFPPPVTWINVEDNQMYTMSDHADKGISRKVDKKEEGISMLMLHLKKLTLDEYSSMDELLKIFSEY